MPRTLVLVLSFFVCTAAAFARQDPRPTEPSPLEPTTWGVVYDVPATARVKVESDVVYRQGASGPNALDVYLPPEAKKGEKRPVVVFLNAIGDPPDIPVERRLRRWGIYRTWPRLVAAHGLAGVAMDAEGGQVPRSLHDLLDWLAKKGGEHGLDGSRVGVYAASANVTATCELLFGAERPETIRAAALYYGNPPEQELRRDLPVLWVVPEYDVPDMGERLEQLWGRVIRAKAPWTLVHAPALPHAFDAFSDADDARRVIQQTIGFWKSHLEPVPQPPWQRSEARAIVAALYGHQSEEAARLLTAWTTAHPDDVTGFSQLGRVLADLGRYQESGRAYERALALGDRSPWSAAGLGFVRAGERKYQEAVELLTRAVAGGIDDGRVLAQLGLSQLMLGRTEEGVRSYEQAIAAGLPPGANSRGIAAFNLACGYARLGRADDAFAQLEVAVTERFATRRALEGDADLAPLRSDARFGQLLAKLPAR